MLPILEIFGRKIGMYSFCAIAGLIISCIIAIILLRKEGVIYEDVILLTLVSIFGIITGGHLLYWIVNFHKIISTFSLISFRQPFEAIKKLSPMIFGMVFYGGFIGSVFAIRIYTKKFHPNKSKIISDVFTLCIPLFHTFARTGCFFAGCCYGIASDFGFITYTNTLIPELNGVVRFPVQLLEAGINLIIFSILFFLYKKRKGKGEILFIYMLIYPICRFFLEFLRGDSVRGFLFFFSTSQWISIILIIVSLVYFLIHKRNREQKGA